MKRELLLELAATWKERAKGPEVEDGSKEAEIRNAKEYGFREGLKKAARDLEDYVRLLTP